MTEIFYSIWENLEHSFEAENSFVFFFFFSMTALRYTLDRVTGCQEYGVTPYPY